MRDDRDLDGATSRGFRLGCGFFGEDKTALQVQGRMSDFSGDKEYGLGKRCNG